MVIEFELSAVIAASPQVIYTAWLDSQGHTAMTGSGAQVSAQLGGEFTAFDGYIQGRNLVLEPYRRIVQAWRTVEFVGEEDDSRVEITLVPVEGGTRLTLHHTNLPAHGAQYEQGWVDNYFGPMAAYFSSSNTQG